MILLEQFLFSQIPTEDEDFQHLTPEEVVVF